MSITSRATRPGRLALALALAIGSLLSGCGSGLKPTEFTNPRFDFGFVERVAVVEFENLTNDREAGFRATRLMVTELLASGAVDVVGAGEVRASRARQMGPRNLKPANEDVVALGKTLGVQALLIGTVTQSEVLRSGRVGIPVVTLDVHMVEVETGASVWAATHTEKGGTFSAKVLGTSGKPISETTRRCVKAVLKTLID